MPLFSLNQCRSACLLVARLSYQSVSTISHQSCLPYNLNCAACMFQLRTALGLSQASASFLLGTYRLDVRTRFIGRSCDQVCHLYLGCYEFILVRYLQKSCLCEYDSIFHTSCISIVVSSKWLLHIGVFNFSEELSG